MNISKLAPLPLEARMEKGSFVYLRGADQVDIATFTIPAMDDAAFHMIARLAFDVMMRRGWIVKQSCRLWTVYCYSGEQLPALRSEAEDGETEWLYPEPAIDPFTALVRADEWYVANIEKEGQQ